MHLADPDLDHDQGDHDVRLVPLDPWERDWIFGAAQQAVSLLPIIPHNQVESIRLLDLLQKMRVRAKNVTPFSR